jgi:hypothetical protein
LKLFLRGKFCNEWSLFGVGRLLLRSSQKRRVANFGVYLSRLNSVSLFVHLHGGGGLNRGQQHHLAVFACQSHALKSIY